MLNVRLAGGHLYGKQLFTWLSLVVSLVASFVLSFFPLDVLDEIWDLIESVSQGFVTYSCMFCVPPSSMFLKCKTDIGFMSFKIVWQFSQTNGRVIMKSCMQWFV